MTYQHHPSSRISYNYVIPSFLLETKVDLGQVLVEPVRVPALQLCWGNPHCLENPNSCLSTHTTWPHLYRLQSLKIWSKISNTFPQLKRLIALRFTRSSCKRKWRHSTLSFLRVTTSGDMEWRAFRSRQEWRYVFLLHTLLTISNWFFYSRHPLFTTITLIHLPCITLFYGRQWVNLSHTVLSLICKTLYWFTTHCIDSQITLSSECWEKKLNKQHESCLGGSLVCL